MAVEGVADEGVAVEGVADEGMAIEGLAYEGPAALQIRPDASGVQELRRRIEVC